MRLIAGTRIYDMILGFQRRRREGGILGLFLSKRRNMEVSDSGSVEFAEIWEGKGEVSEEIESCFR